MKMNKLLFYTPYKLPQKKTSGSSVRPGMMLEAFKEIGLDVEVIQGSSAERKKLIQNFKAKSDLNKILGVYVESSSMPLALTDSDHLPRHPFMDMFFLKYLKQRGIPVSLFYRDIYWRFPSYRHSVKFYKRYIAQLFYRIEWNQIEKVVDHLFLPSVRMNKSLIRPWSELRLSALPPGCSACPSDPTSHKLDGKLRLLYIGGVTPPIYDIRPMFRAISGMSNVKLQICCRKPEWLKNISIYNRFLSNNIEIIHKSGVDLLNLYKNCDIVVILRYRDPYLDFAMPVKVFEALGCGKPIITTYGTAAADFVKKEQIGWTPKTISEAAKLFNYLQDNPDEIRKKANLALSVRYRHLWTSRAKQVVEKLQYYRKLS